MYEEAERTLREVAEEGFKSLGPQPDLPPHRALQLCWWLLGKRLNRKKDAAKLRERAMELGYDMNEY